MERVKLRSLTSFLHSGLKMLITPVLGGLLENDISKMFEFKDFFKWIEMVHRKKVCRYHSLCQPSWRASVS